MSPSWLHRVPIPAFDPSSLPPPGTWFSSSLSSLSSSWRLNLLTIPQSPHRLVGCCWLPWVTELYPLVTLSGNRLAPSVNRRIMTSDHPSSLLHYNAFAFGGIVDKTLASLFSASLETFFSHHHMHLSQTLSSSLTPLFTSMWKRHLLANGYRILPPRTISEMVSE